MIKIDSKVKDDQHLGMEGVYRQRNELRDIYMNENQSYG
jgi:hypothetical protein